jgi:glycosyltransferase involved in cell wall biosynthesis
LGDVTIAYIVGRYPSASHTFIRREIEALRRLGVSIETVSIHRPGERDALSEADRGEARRTHAILPTGPLRLLLAHITILARRPRAYLRALRIALNLSRPGIKGHLWYFFYLSEAVLAWHNLRGREIEHVHAHHINQASDVALFAATLGGWTWSFTMHGPTELYDVRHFRLAEKVVRADLVACISHFCRSQLMGLVASEHWSKLRLVHCGVDPQLFRANRNLGNRGSRPFEILNVGRLVGTKGQAVLLEALADLRSRDMAMRATIIGEGSNRAELQEMAERFRLADAVQFVGAVGQDDIASYYERADVFCLPSFAEGVPVVLMEAMAMGVPVVATHVMGVPELVDDGTNGLLVSPGCADQLAEALRRLAVDPELRRRISAAGQRKVATSFHIAKSAEDLARAFADVTRSRGGRSPRDERWPVAGNGQIDKSSVATELSAVLDGVGRE